jgi:hypothetical protein
MCHSARIWQDYRKYVRAYGADLSVTEFVDLYSFALTEALIPHLSAKSHTALNARSNASIGCRSCLPDMRIA